MKRGVKSRVGIPAAEPKPGQMLGAVSSCALVWESQTAGLVLGWEPWVLNRRNNPPGGSGAGGSLWAVHAQGWLQLPWQLLEPRCGSKDLAAPVIAARTRALPCAVRVPLWGLQLRKAHRKMEPQVSFSEWRIIPCFQSGKERDPCADSSQRPSCSQLPLSCILGASCHPGKLGGARWPLWMDVTPCWLQAQRTAWGHGQCPQRGLEASDSVSTVPAVEGTGLLPSPLRGLNGAGSTGHTALWVL